MQTLLWLTIALPLAGAVILLLGGRATDRWGHLLACAAVVASFFCCAALFANSAASATSRARVNPLPNRQSTSTSPATASPPIGYCLDWAPSWQNIPISISIW